MEITIKEKQKIHSKEDVAKIFRSILEAESEIDRDKEHFWVMGLDVANQIKYIELVSFGTLDRNFVHPREVFRLAILKGVASLIACHNHPSGNTAPSDDDIKLTKRLREAGEIIGIEIIDHVIIGNGTSNAYAFAGNGWKGER